MLEFYKRQVIDYALRAQRDGLCKHKSGNFSVRDPETGYICITPTGVDREKLTEEDIVVLDQDLVILEGAKPSSETMMHVEIYKMRPDVFAICHTHAKMGTAFSVLGKPLPAIIYEVAGFHLDEGQIPVAPYGRPGTPELAQKVAETAKHSDLMLMEKHGTIAVGPDMDTAYLNVNYIEEIAEIYYYTLVIGRGAEPPSFDVEELRRWQYPQTFRRKEDAV